MIGQNDTNYDKFKTPVFTIKIGNSAGSNLTELPPSLASLVQKIEITETLQGCAVTQQFIIVFKEGSREPFNRSFSTDTKSLYSDADITNSSGMLCDLRFTILESGERGFTSRIPSQVGAISSLSSGSSLVTALPGLDMSKAENKIIVADDIPQTKNAEYVFNQRNLVEVAWGYAEDPSSIRRITGYIAHYQADFTENDMPQFTVTCMGPESAISQLTPTKAMHLNVPIIAGADDETGEPLYIYEDLDMEAAIKKVFKDFKVIVSSNILSKKTDKNHSKVIPADKSPDQFLREARRGQNAVFINYYSSTQKKPVIVYLSRNDWLSKEVVNNRTLFTWNAQGSILKSIGMKAEFNGLTGAATGGVGSDGVPVRAVTNHGDSAEVKLFNKSLLDTQPTGGNSIPWASSLNSILGNDKEVISKTELSPAADEPANLVDTAKSRAACKNNLVYLEFSALGYSKVTNGLIYFGGIGNRFSGQYELIRLTHTIDQNGYHMTGSAQATGLSDQSGVVPKNASEVQNSGPETETINLFKPQLFSKASPGSIGLPSSSSSKTPLDEYLEDVLA